MICLASVLFWYIGGVCDLLNLENYSAKSFSHNLIKISTSKIECYTVYIYIPYMLKQAPGRLFLKGHEKPGVYLKVGVYSRRAFISSGLPDSLPTLVKGHLCQSKKWIATRKKALLEDTTYIKVYGRLVPEKY